MIEFIYTYIVMSEIIIKIFMFYVFDNMVDELYSLMLYSLCDDLIFESSNTMCLML